MFILAIFAFVNCGQGPAADCRASSPARTFPEMASSPSLSQHAPKGASVMSSPAQKFAWADRAPALPLRKLTAQSLRRTLTGRRIAEVSPRPGPSHTIQFNGASSVVSTMIGGTVPVVTYTGTYQIEGDGDIVLNMSRVNSRLRQIVSLYIDADDHNFIKYSSSSLDGGKETVSERLFPIEIF
jgi:hypothetical protein